MSHEHEPNEFRLPQVHMMIVISDAGFGRASYRVMQFPSRDELPPPVQELVETHSAAYRAMRLVHSIFERYAREVKRSDERADEGATLPTIIKAPPPV